MIFRKNKPENMSPQAHAQPEQPPAAEQPVPDVAEQHASPMPMEQPASMAHGNTSVLTSDVVMEGNLLTSGELHLDGTVHGAVQASRVIIDVNGAVNGQVVAQEIVVRGRAIGPICGVRIELAPGAQVQGDVISQSIVVQDGAFIDGQIRHSEDPLGEWQQMWHDAEADAQEAVPLQYDMSAEEVAEDMTSHGEEPEQAASAEEPSAPYLRQATEGSESGTGEEDSPVEADAGEKSNNEANNEVNKEANDKPRADV